MGVITYLCPTVSWSLLVKGPWSFARCCDKTSCLSEQRSLAVWIKGLGNSNFVKTYTKITTHKEVNCVNAFENYYLRYLIRRISERDKYLCIYRFVNILPVHYVVSLHVDGLVQNWYFQCLSKGYTAALHQVIDISLFVGSQWFTVSQCSCYHFTRITAVIERLMIDWQMWMNCLFP